MQINNIQDLALELCCDANASFDRIERLIYEETDCGAWIQQVDGGVRCGSIVEGSDAEISTDPLLFPFDSTELYDTLDYIEGEAKVEWDLANNANGEWD